MHTIIRKAIERILSDRGKSGLLFSVEHPADFLNGDYSTNVALVLANQIGMSPRDVASMIVEKLNNTIAQVEKIEIAGPGFINFYLTRSFFRDAITDILMLNTAWGKSDAFAGEKILFEYTSPNLFKPLHIGNLVGNIIGESISRLYKFHGAEVVRLSYPSDIGLTVAKGVWALKVQNANADDIMALGAAYRYGNELYENNPEAKEAIEAVNRALYAESDPELSEIRRRGIETSKRAIDALCEKLGTTFDGVIYESDASPKGAEIVRENMKTGIFEQLEDGPVIYCGEKHGLHTRVFLNSQGLPTYEAKDVGNFSIKNAQYPDWTHMYVVTGGEQREYFKVLIAAIKDIYPKIAEKTFVHIPTGFLTLTTGKMSSRLGNVLTGEDVLSDLRDASLARAAESRADDVSELATQIATAAIKYQILRQAIGTDIVFDKERALSFEGASGPYLQYTYARTCSVLERAAAVGVVPATTRAPEKIYVLERYLYQFPEVTLRATELREPHRLVTYLTEMSLVFNTFYGQERIADATDEYAPYKVALTEAVRETLQQGLYLLGIPTPGRM